MTYDISIGRGDNAPSPSWAMPFAVAGSDFDLVITMPGGAVETLTVSGGGLVLDTVANTVTWPVTTAQSAVLPYTSLYTLRRIVQGGEVRYYVQGRIFGVDGPVGPSSVTVTGVGPAGPPGHAGPSAYDSYVALGGTLTEAEWSAPASEFPAASQADALAGLRDDVVITPATLRAALVAYAPSSSGSTSPPSTTPTSGSSPGGGPSNTADFSDPNNAYLAGAL